MSVGEKRFLGLGLYTWIYITLGLAAVLTTAALTMTFFFTPVVLADTVVDELRVIGGVPIQNQLLFSQKIFYFHVPVAMSSFLVFIFTALNGVRFLIKKEKIYDTKARIATEVTLLFVLLTMATGILWTRYEWGTWWVWEPRLTTYFILTLMVIGYFVLRNSIDDEERRATYAAAFGIIAFINAPISFAITRLVPSSAHPVVFRAGGGLISSQLIAFFLGMAGMLLFAWSVYQIRLREQDITDRVEVAKAALEE